MNISSCCFYLEGKNKEEMTGSSKSPFTVCTLWLLLMPASQRGNRKRMILIKKKFKTDAGLLHRNKRAPLFTHKKATSAGFIIFKRITSLNLTKVKKTSVMFPAYCWCHTGVWVGQNKNLSKITTARSEAITWALRAMKILISHSANLRGETEKYVLGPLSHVPFQNLLPSIFMKTSLTPNRFSSVPEMQQEGRKWSLSPPFEIVSQWGRAYLSGTVFLSG